MIEFETRFAAGPGPLNGKLERVEVGKKFFPYGPVDVTDPCYDSDVWCRINGLYVQEGDYTCAVTLRDENEWGIRVARIGIYRDGNVPKAREMKLIGEIGVDSAMAGFFMGKPDYSTDEWIDLCEQLGTENDAWIINDGFFSRSGFGDGGYQVLGHLSDTTYLWDALEIVFI